MKFWPRPTERRSSAGRTWVGRWASLALDPGATPRLMVADVHAAPVDGVEPVLLLHGQPGDRHDWDPVVARLGEATLVVVPDRPGYGRTGGAARGIGANADAIVELLDRLGLVRVTVGGFSWGGAVALSFALRYPERVGALVLVGSVGGSGSVDSLDRLLAAPVIGPILALSGLAALRASRVRRLVGSVHSPGDPTAVRVPDGWLGWWRSFVAEERALVTEIPAITARLREIQAPAIVVTGSADRVVRPATQTALAGALAQARLVRIPDCGHLLPMEAPDVIADLLIRAASRPA